MRSATFRNIALGILALAAAYHLGARSATAQAPGNSVVGTFAGSAVVTANGDIYDQLGGAFHPGFPYQHLGNVFYGGPVPVQRETFGQLKARYRPQGAAQPTQDR